MTTDLKTSNDWSSSVVPTLAALCVTTVQVIERAQVDWTADCAKPGVCAETARQWLAIDWFTPLPAIFVFAVLHAMLRQYPLGLAPSPAERAVRVLMFVAISVFPALGWYLFYAGVAGGLVAAITIIGLPFAPFVGVLSAGAFAGLVLAFAAGPAMTAGWSVWRSVLFRYALGTAIATAVLVAGYMVFDPQFVNAAQGQVWLGGLGVLAATALACCIVTTTALSGRPRSGVMLASSTYRTAGTLAVVCAVLAIIAEFAASNSLTVFARENSRVGPVAAYIRAYKPWIATPLSLGGLAYVGPRSLVMERSATGRQRQKYEVRDAGTPREKNYSWTETETVQEWRLVPPISPQQAVYVIADVAMERRLYCEPAQEGREFCVHDMHRLKGPRPAGSTRRLALDLEDANEFDVAHPDAALAIRFDARKHIDGVQPSELPRLYCRLNLINVGPAKFSVHQIVPCDRPWGEQAARVRTHVEAVFRSQPQQTTPATKAQ
jgi:hypothetical protein